jgi:carbamoyl-phosphate synthase small subunit
VLRSAGVMRGVIATGHVDPKDLVEKARALPQMEGSDLVKDVTCGAAFEWGERASRFGEADHQEFGAAPTRCASKPLRIAAYDYGIKYNILRRLSAYGCDVRVFPASAPASDLLAIDPDGVFLSNGPGDPAVLSYAIDNVRELLKVDVPMFGICLGHQILGLAYGATTYKLKFGHRGANHPVKDLASGKVEITSQNHGFAVDPASLPSDVKPTHVNLYDGTLEGFRHVSRPVFSVQYHPEASPGPHDADYLFCQFLDSIEKR